jgi:hypothetical protein
VLLFQFTPYARYLAPVLPLLVSVCIAFLEWSRRYSKTLWRAGAVFTSATTMVNLGYLTSTGGPSIFPCKRHSTTRNATSMSPAS